MDEVKLLGLQRAEFQRAETLASRSNKAQVVIVMISIIAVFIKDSNISYLLALSSLVTAVLCFYFNHQAKHSHSTAERARRAIILRNGLGIKLSRKSYSDLIMQFKVHESESKEWEDSDYFKTERDYSNKKLAEIVEESAFWSKHLLKFSATRYWIYSGITLTLSIIGLLIVPLLNIGKLSVLISQVFCLILLWLISGHLFTKAMVFTDTANAVDNIEGRLSNMLIQQEPDEDILIIFGDYNSLLESTPTIPSVIS